MVKDEKGFLQPNLGRYKQRIKGDLKVYYALLFAGIEKKELDSMTADELYEARAAYEILHKTKPPKLPGRKGGR